MTCILMCILIIYIYIYNYIIPSDNYTHRVYYVTYGTECISGVICKVCLIIERNLCNDVPWYLICHLLLMMGYSLMT